MDYGNACDESRSPFISICNYNAAYETLNAMYPGLIVRFNVLMRTFSEFYESIAKA